MKERTPDFSGRIPSLQRRHRPQLNQGLIQQGELSEHHLTLLPQPGESAAGMVERLAELLSAHNATVVRHEVFGALAAQPDFVFAQQKLFGEQAWPVTWVEGASCAGNAIAGMHVLAVAGTRVESLSAGGRVVGRVFNDGHARHCLLGDLRPTDPRASREQQAMEVFENIETALRHAGMSMLERRAHLAVS